jgi:hypothetical protein
MGEKIVSPGVFTNEIDVSYLPQGISGIGAAFIGPTVKGPAFIPTVVGSYSDFAQIFGDTNPNYYLPYTAKEYLANSNKATIVRVLHESGYDSNGIVNIHTSINGVDTSIGLLHPSQIISENLDFYDDTTPLFQLSGISSGTPALFNFNISGSFTVDSVTFPNAKDTTNSRYTASLDPTSANYLGKIFSRTPGSTSDPVYLYTFFNNAAASVAAVSQGVQLQSAEFAILSGYSEAQTPWIISQTFNNSNQPLFKFHTIADGNSSNYEVKVAISNIKPAGTVAGSEYGSFTVTIRAVDQTKLKAYGSPYNYTDSDLRPNILESFDNVNLDPNSARYIARVIGDQYTTYTNGKVVVSGDYSNKSSYVYVEVDETVAKASNPVELVPFGFEALTSIIPKSFTAQPPSASFVTSQTVNGIYNKRKYFGFDYDFDATDNANYLRSLPANQTKGSNINFLLSDYSQDAAAAGGAGTIGLTSATSIYSRQFIVPFQGGFDGIQPNRRALVGSEIVAGNVQGFDLTNNTTSDYTSYTNAIDTVSNPDEIDINMLVLPGIIETLHPAVIDYASQMCLDRQDTFLIFDCVGLGDDIATATDAVIAIDNNYAATYYPWVKIMDTNINKPVWVPPSVVLPGVLAFNDKVAAEWYAPAGLNRGGLSSALDTYTRLANSERDMLYEGRVNPIGTFPGVGIAVWGQKTLQAKPSALDRVNVRRLLIAVKKYIASASRYLVFEQNTAATRNRFLNIVNPYLESVQQRQGVYAFKVVMDESNNTPDVIDRNIMYGQLFLQPTKTSEFIVLDFNILPTGAAFPGA